MHLLNPRIRYITHHNKLYSFFRNEHLRGHQVQQMEEQNKKVSSFQGLEHQQSSYGRIHSNQVTICLLSAWLKAEAVIQDIKKYLKSPLVMPTSVSVLTFPTVSSVTFYNIPLVPELVSASYEAGLKFKDHLWYFQHYYMLTQPRQQTGQISRGS